MASTNADLCPTFVFLSLIFFLAAFASSYSSASPSSAENNTLSALLHFKASISYDPDGIVSSWNTSSDFCRWPGIYCDGSGGWSLSLSYRNLSGILSPQIGNLQGLSYLDLAHNKFFGSVPTQLSNLSLRYLDLSYNHLSGALPSSLGQLKSLQYLDLSKNQLSGTLPSSLAQLKSLQYLYLSSNQLSGPLPSSLGQMKGLQYLHLSYNELYGPLPSSLGQLKSLQELYLSFNQLSDPLPSSLGQMQSLQYLDLSNNQLSGTLPSSLGQLKSLLHLYLSYNELYGALPSSLGQMKSLQNLYLSNNQLSGPLASFVGQLKSLQYLDLSQNQLSGPLPSSLTNNLYFFNVSYNRLQGMIPTVYENISASSFFGNPGLCGPPLVTSCTSHSKRTMKLCLLVLVCVVGAVGLMLAFVWAWRHLVYNKRDLGSDFVVPQYKAWTAEEMRVATNDFDAANVIGSGAMSRCYVGVTKVPELGMRVVAVKRLTVADYDEGRKSFVHELTTLCKMRHRNLVKVLGYCVEGEEIALVMEYMERGDLDRRLHNQGTSNLTNYISWEERVNVALDVAEGLVYLHHEYGQPIIHRDLKPKNILLSSDMVAKICDFGIAKLLEANETGDMSMSKLRGTFGYIAPEYGMGSRISTKVDVYSYGMLLLELVTEVRPTSPMLEEEDMSLRTWVEKLLASGKIREKLMYYDLDILQEVDKLLRLGVQCTHNVAKERPNMYIVRDSILRLKNKML